MTVRGVDCGLVGSPGLGSKVGLQMDRVLMGSVGSRVLGELGLGLMHLVGFGFWGLGFGWLGLSVAGRWDGFGFKGGWCWGVEERRWGQ